ncbi:PREDICTED: CD48 antigen-like [Cyprinodon variegatus]|uniref:CD48 antigen-like n=1 Tax=Cyprinodon variegatus TaxID=28743 RepID=UPI00074297AA|nr:PREDICTED: CD48 antigen-like [Cyprinodon variegatus]
MNMSIIWPFPALLLIISTKLSDADPIYRKVGGSVVLYPDDFSKPIMEATWKHNPDFVLEWFGQEIISYRSFKGRCDFDKTSGSLTINSLTLEDSGSYTPEINNKVLAKKKLQVIKPVPKPTVSIKSNHEKDAWSLTCEAQVTADFGPVTYKWKTGDTELSSDKELLITTENKESSFFCELVNPVSSSSSETVEIPFTIENPALAVAVAVGIILLVAAVIGAVFFSIWKCGETAQKI